MYIKTILAVAVAASSLLASNLANDAKKAGLVAIPNTTSELLKLIDNPKNPITAEKVELGKKLYFEPRISKSGLISCNTCHNLAEGGDDGLAAAVGHKWTVNPHHLGSPTVFNSVFFSAQFWDGRDPDLEKQAQGPILAAPEMSASKEHVVGTITSIPAYVSEFKKAYGNDVKIDYVKITDTIATFERTLVTPSAFDNYLNGSDNALTAAQEKGLQTFLTTGCATCHNGIAIGGNMNTFNFAEYKYSSVGDFKGDKYGMVKVPTLRNITQTAPYFHNGQIATLKEAIIEMARIQLNKKLSNDDAESIEEFLKTLEGEKGDIVLPLLPASSETTPKPDIN